MLVLLEVFPVFSKHFEYSLTDLKFNLRSQLNREPNISENIVMVNLDDYSKAQSKYDLWPYEYYAETIETINNGDPTSLGIDIFFTLSVDTIGWRRLLSAVENSFVSLYNFGSAPSNKVSNGFSTFTLPIGWLVFLSTLSN